MLSPPRPGPLGLWSAGPTRGYPRNPGGCQGGVCEGRETGEKVRNSAEMAALGPLSPVRDHRAHALPLIPESERSPATVLAVVHARRAPGRDAARGRRRRTGRSGRGRPGRVWCCVTLRIGLRLIVLALVFLALVFLVLVFRCPAVNFCRATSTDTGRRGRQGWQGRRSNEPQSHGDGQRPLQSHGPTSVRPTAQAPYRLQEKTWNARTDSRIRDTRAEALGHCWMIRSRSASRKSCPLGTQ
jgi:hypothetical protein